LNSQSAAIRCLGVYQLFKSMTEDINYLFDVSMLSIEILESFRDLYYAKKLSHLLLYQSSWTLANFCDILKKFYLHNTNEITIEFMLRLIESNVNCFDLQFTNTMQSENIKTNFVRSSGSALYVILNRQQSRTSLETNTRFCKLFNELIHKLIHTLNGSKNFKLQWNICIAFSYLLELQLFLHLCECTTHLPQINTDLSGDRSIDSDYQLIDCICDTLLNLMQTSRNHKVQSYAVSAICSVNSDHFNDKQLSSLWVLITNFMIQNLSLVPINIRDNWFEKFCVSINKLIVNYFNANIRSDDNIKHTVENLVQFLHNDSNFINHSQESPEFVGTLIQNLNSL